MTHIYIYLKEKHQNIKIEPRAELDLERSQVAGEAECWQGVEGCQRFAWEAGPLWSGDSGGPPPAVEKQEHIESPLRCRRCSESPVRSSLLRFRPQHWAFRCWWIFEWKRPRTSQGRLYISSLLPSSINPYVDPSHFFLEKKWNHQISLS